jgi:hypothetical protein
MSAAPRLMYVCYALAKRTAHIADSRAHARRSMVNMLAEELLSKEVTVTTDAYCETHSMAVYVLTASELQRLIDDRVARAESGMPYYHY